MFNLFYFKDKVPVVSWRNLFELVRRLKGLLLRVPLISSASITREVSLAAVHFVRHVIRLKRKSGYLFTALYFFQCGVSLQRFYAGCYDPKASISVPVSLTRSGIPRVIPAVLRSHLRRRDSHGDMLVKGMSWEPTWKSTPIQDSFLRSKLNFSVDEKVDRLCNRYSRFQNIFVNLKHEIAAFIFKVNKIHSLQDGFFSPGILWYPRVLYPLDYRMNTWYANWDLDYFERCVGPYFATLLGAYKGLPIASGRLSQVIEGSGKRRIFAICNYVQQRLLRPVHDWAMNVLKRLPSDGTFNQERPLLRLRELKRDNLFSFDLKSATVGH